MIVRVIECVCVCVRACMRAHSVCAQCVICDLQVPVGPRTSLWEATANRHFIQPLSSCSCFMPYVKCPGTTSCTTHALSHLSESLARLCLVRYIRQDKTHKCEFSERLLCLCVAPLHCCVWFVRAPPYLCALVFVRSCVLTRVP